MNVSFKYGIRIGFLNKDFSELAKWNSRKKNKNNNNNNNNKKKKTDGKK